MKNFNFTKGKWYFEKSGELEPKFKAYKIGFSSEHTQGVLGFVSSALMPDNEPLANAKLIAAAPELLEALIELKSMIDSKIEIQGPFIEAYIKAQKAIDKAQ